MKLTEITENLEKTLNLKYLIKKLNILSGATINKDYSVSVNQFVEIYDKFFNQLPFKFNIVNGDFRIKNCKNLINLIGVPNECHDFSVYDNGLLKNLEGCSEMNILGSVRIFNNSSLVSLSGLPAKLNEHFNITNNPELKSIKTGPTEINGHYWISNCPKIIDYLHLFNISGIEEVHLDDNYQLDSIYNKHLKNPDRDEGMIECRQELRDAGFGEYARLK